MRCSLTQHRHLAPPIPAPLQMGAHISLEFVLYCKDYIETEFVANHICKIMRPFRSVSVQPEKLIFESLKAIEDVIVSTFPGVASLLTGAITAALIARGLGPFGMGQYALAISVSTFTLGVSDMGIGQTAIRYASRAASQGDVEGQFAILRWTFRLRILFVLGLSLVVFVLAPTMAGTIWHDTSLTPILQLSLLIGIFGTLAHVPIIYSQSIRRFRMNSIIQVAQALISFGGIVLVAFFALWHVELVMFVSVVAAFIGALAFITVTPKAAFFKFGTSWRSIHFKLRGVLTPPAIKRGEKSALDSSSIGSFARFNFIDQMVSVAVTTAPVWIMGIFLVKSQIGVYTAAVYVALPISVLVTAVTTALWPRVAAATTLEGNKDLLSRAMLLTVLAVVGVLFYAVFAPLLIPFVFGVGYASGILVAQLLCLGWCIYVLATPFFLVGYNFGVVRISWLINAGMLIIIIAINVWLLPIIGPVAAASAWLIATIFSAACNGIFVWSKMRRFTTQEWRQTRF
jgi:O-antigen/teichoic acid export membrane protein